MLRENYLRVRQYNGTVFNYHCLNKLDSVASPVLYMFVPVVGPHIVIWFVPLYYFDVLQFLAGQIHPTADREQQTRIQVGLVIIIIIIIIIINEHTSTGAEETYTE